MIDLPQDGLRRFTNLPKRTRSRLLDNLTGVRVVVVQHPNVVSKGDRRIASGVTASKIMFRAQQKRMFS